MGGGLSNIDSIYLNIFLVPLRITSILIDILRPPLFNPKNVVHCCFSFFLFLGQKDFSVPIGKWEAWTNPNNNTYMNLKNNRNYRAYYTTYPVINKELIPPNHLLVEPRHYHGDRSKFTLLPWPW